MFLLHRLIFPELNSLNPLIESTIALELPDQTYAPVA
jgi:hypothetical protein